MIFLESVNIWILHINLQKFEYDIKSYKLFFFLCKVVAAVAQNIFKR